MRVESARNGSRACACKCLAINADDSSSCSIIFEVLHWNLSEWSLVRKKYFFFRNDSSNIHCESSRLDSGNEKSSSKHSGAFLQKKEFEESNNYGKCSEKILSIERVTHPADCVRDIPLEWLGNARRRTNHEQKRLHAHQAGWPVPCAALKGWCLTEIRFTFYDWIWFVCCDRWIRLMSVWW